MIEAFKEFKAGYDYELDGDDVQLLNDSTQAFEQVRPEKELILKYFKHPEFAKTDSDVEFMQAMEIKAYLERLTNQRLIITKIVQELRGLNFMGLERVIDGQSRHAYSVIRRNEQEVEQPDEIAGASPF